MRLINCVCAVATILFCVVASVIAPTASVATPAAITPPTQPSTGPGGSQYAHASVTEHSFGDGDLQYWLFEPAGPKPESAPVVIFNHGWSAMTPHGYRAWIDHIVRRGNIVIYPRYQATLRTKPSTMGSNAIAATKDALRRLSTESGHVRPQLDKLAVVGHSAGGQISAGMAARAASAGLPPIKAVMCVEPGKSWGPNTTHIPMDDLSTMPAATLLLTLAGDRDTIVRDIDAKRIINETVRIPAANKNYVKIISDSHGSPALVANHFCPAASSGGDRSAEQSGTANTGGLLKQIIKERIEERLQQRASQRGKDSENVIDAQQAGAPLADQRNMHGINALDFYCTWKLFDALEDAAFYGKNRDYALGNTPRQRYMGNWSDGVPVKELVIQIGQAK